jgi:hypothetical protein
MKLLDVFGTRLSELTGFQSFHSIGLLRLAAKDAKLNPDGPLTYQDMKVTIQTHMNHRLRALSIANADDITQKMLATLNDKQSLFTVAVH